MSGLVEITDDGLKLDLFWSEVVAGEAGAPTGSEIMFGLSMRREPCTLLSAPTLQQWISPGEAPGFHEACSKYGVHSIYAEEMTSWLSPLLQAIG